MTLNNLWGIFEKRLVDLSIDEQVVLALVVLISVCLVVIAFSMVLQVARGLDMGGEAEKTYRLLRKGLGRRAVQEPVLA